jgi:hypothetical protein
MVAKGQEKPKPGASAPLHRAFDSAPQRER